MTASAPALSRCLCRDAAVRSESCRPPSSASNIRFAAVATVTASGLPTRAFSPPSIWRRPGLLLWSRARSGPGDRLPAHLGRCSTASGWPCCGGPSTAAALSLAMIVVLILLSQFKHGILMMTATFVDVMLIDVDTFTFLLTIIPGSGLEGRARRAAGAAAARAALAARSVPGAPSPRRRRRDRALLRGAGRRCRLRCRPIARTSSTATTTSPSSRVRPRSPPSI